MKVRCFVFGLAMVLVPALAYAGARDWIFDNGPYTVNPKTGQRVDQYKKVAPSKRLSYDKYFSPNGPGAYIPTWYYEEELGEPYGGGYAPGWGGYGGGYGGNAFPYTPYGS